MRHRRHAERSYMTERHTKHWKYETEAIVNYLKQSSESELRPWLDDAAYAAAAIEEDGVELALTHLGWSLRDDFGNLMFPRDGSYDLTRDLAGAAFTRIDWDAVAEFVMELGGYL